MFYDPYISYCIFPRYLTHLLKFNVNSLGKIILMSVHIVIIIIKIIIIIIILLIITLFKSEFVLGEHEYPSNWGHFNPNKSSQIDK